MRSYYYLVFMTICLLPGCEKDKKADYFVNCTPEDLNLNAKDYSIVFVIDNTFGRYDSYDVSLLRSAGFNLKTISFYNLDTEDFSDDDLIIIGWDPGFLNRDSTFYTNVINSGKPIILKSADIDAFGLGTSTGNTSYGLDVTINKQNPANCITAYFTNKATLSDYSIYRIFVSSAQGVEVIASIDEGDVIILKNNILYYGLLYISGITDEGNTLYLNCVKYMIQK